MIKKIFRKLINIVPKRRIQPISAFSGKGIAINHIFNSEKFKMPLLKDILGESHNAFYEYEIDIPNFYVFSIKCGKCIVGREEIFTKDNKVITEITSQKVNPFNYQDLYLLSNTYKIKGKVVNLSLSGLENNYYHYSVEFLARLHLLYESKINPDYYIFPNKTRFHMDFINLLNIDRNKIINLKEGTVIQADEIIAPSLINNWEYVEFRGYKHCQKQWVPSWTGQIYAKYIDMNIMPNKRIFISRNKAKYRKIENEEEVIEVLKNYGFEKFELEELSLKEQIELFNNAKIVIAPHGAGLINMSYCKKGTIILEIYPEWYHDASFRIQALALEHDYHYLIARSNLVENINAQMDNLIVDTELLQKFIREIAE